MILDPAYKVLGNGDENANRGIAGLMNELEALARSSGAAVIVAHHFAKGGSANKEAMDPMSGAGAWACDPDSILVLPNLCGFLSRGAQHPGGGGYPPLDAGELHLIIS